MTNVIDFISRKHIQYLLLGIITVLVYFPVLGNEFLFQWDDQWMVTNIYTEGGFNWSNIYAIFIEYYNGQYAPLTELSFLIIYTFAGYSPFWFHFACLLWHIGCVYLVMLLVSRLLNTQKGISVPVVSFVPFITALLFAIQPFNVESVAWVSAVKIPLYTFFYLWASLCYFKYIESEKLKSYIYALVLFTLSFMAKEQAVTFPVWLILMYLICGHKLNDKKMWITVAPFFVLSLLFGFITMVPQGFSGRVLLLPAESYTFGQRIVFACYTLFEYLFKSLIPFKLSYLYPFPSQVGQPLPSWILVYPALLVIIVVSLRKYLVRPFILFGLLFFLIHIAIALHIIPMDRYAIVADRYAYLAYVGVAFILSYGLVLCYQRSGDRLRKLVIALFTCYLLYFGIYAHLRTYDWRSSNTIKKELRELLKQRDDYKP